MTNTKQYPNLWTLGLAAAGVVSMASVLQAEETQNQVATALSSTTLSGYVDTSAIWHFGNGNGLVGRVFDQGTSQGGVLTAPGYNKQDGFNLNVVKLQLEKPLDEAQWSAGYNVSLMFGPDANAIGSTSTGVNTSDFAVRNAYVSLRAPLGNGLDFKIGVWDTPVGYEVLDSASNPNYSHSFAYFLEPVVHTGVQTTYKVNDIISVSAGIANRGDVNNINSRTAIESLKTYMGGITLTAPESFGTFKGATLSAWIMDHGIAGASDQTHVYVGATTPTPLTALSVGAAYDYRGSDTTDGIVGTSRYANAVSGYLIYQVTEKLKVANRGEYATGTTGTFYAAAPGKNNALFGYTLTADYSLWSNVTTRAEFRWDHELHGVGIFNDGTDRNALSLALNVIYKF